MGFENKTNEEVLSPGNDTLTRAILGVIIGTALLTLGGVLVFGAQFTPKDTEPLAQLVWVQPTVQSFVVLADLAIAVLCFGRYRALGGAWVFWSGLVFVGAAVLGLFYLLSWPGLLGDRGVIAQLSNTASWFFELISSCVVLLLITINLRRPERLNPSLAFAGYVLLALVSVLIGLVSVLAENSLPLMIEGIIFTPLALVWTGVLIILAFAAAALAYRRYLKEHDTMLGYMTLFLVMIAFSMLNSIIGGKRYDIWWYFGRIYLVAGYTAVLFGFLQEGYRLFGREKQRLEERGRLLAEVQHRASELDAANQELEAFAYSVAHDLRTPLRAIDGFSQVLLEDYADKLDEDGKEALRFVRHGAQQMGQIIEDMLTLSRITRREMLRKEVDLSKLARSVAAELQRPQSQRKMDFIISRDLTVVGDEGLLKIVLENLLGNAWKFTSNNPEARIEFGSTEQEGETIYFVRDNGVGFDTAYADKLFKPFERLHRDEEFSGTGIGLAIVQRIIHRHGGDVWGEGEVNKGATFYFTLG